MTAPAQTSEQRLAQFFRDMTLNNPKWISRAEALVNCGDKPMIRLLSGYLPVLPPSLRGAVLDARARQVVAVGQIRRNTEGVVKR